MAPAKMEAQIACFGARIGTKGCFLAKTENDKREHVIKLNLARRHLEPCQWGAAFKMLLDTKGVKRGQGSSAKINAILSRIPCPT